MKTAVVLPVLSRQRKRAKRTLARPHFYSPPQPDNRFIIYAEKAMEIIDKNDSGRQEGISEASRRQLVALQRKLWGRPTI